MNVGEAVITISGIGDYSGKIKKTFAIRADITPVENLTVENVTSDNKDAVEFVKEMLENADRGSVDEETLQQWDEIADTCDKLLDKIEKTAASQRQFPHTKKVA